MILLDTKKRHFKVINIIVVYAIILNITIPSAQAMNTFMAENYWKVLVPAKLVSTDMNTIHVAAPSEVVRINTETKPLSIQKQQFVAPTTGTTTGGGQSETSGFSISSTDGMVNKFTGDFSYSIPLGDVEGYPLVLNYNSNIAMNTDASWVGLGFTLNAGDVSREMRGLPDEFNGEQTIVRTFNQAKDEINDGRKTGVYVGVGKEYTYWQPGLQLTMIGGKYTSNYLGKGTTFDLSFSGRIGLGSDEMTFGLQGSGSFGYSFDSKRGVGSNRSLGLSVTVNPAMQTSAGIVFGNSFNSRAGLMEKTQGFSLQPLGEGSLGASSTFPYGTKTSVPSVRLTSVGSSFYSSLDGYFGKINGTNSWRVGVIKAAYSNENSIILNTNQQITQSAIGYFHSGKRSKYSNEVTATNLPLMDFNRSNDNEYSEQMKHLAFSFQTYDVFAVNALGVGETFRARRQDVGTYYDPLIESQNNGFGIDLGVGGLTAATYTKIGISVSVPINNGEITSSNLTNSSSQNVLEFNSENKGKTFDQAIYFKSLGEITPESTDDFATLGGLDPSRVLITKSPDEKSVSLTNTMKTSTDFSSTINSTTINQPSTTYRASYFKPYTALEYVTIEPNICSFTSFGPTMYGTVLNTPRKNASTVANSPRYDNHLSAIEVVSTDGMKYTFSTPMYELLSSQVSFCAIDIPNTNGIANYNAPVLPDITDADNSLNNPRGVSHYFDKTDVPAYPHSFLLTKMVSSDYVDRGTVGIGFDDVGSAYEFNYTKEYGESNPYKWKYPMGLNKAVFNQGNIGTNEDDIASYTYGEKEIWYMHSIESKNLIAEFVLNDKVTDPRMDGYGVKNENGELDPTKALRKLSKIVIYNRSERLGVNGANAIPLQTIEFEYSYELCPNTPSNINSPMTVPAAPALPTTGKLTLKAIRSYGGNAREMGIYSYSFTYDMYNNPAFAYDKMDEWGNYLNSTAARPNDFYPYAEQNAVVADATAKAWKLKTIKNPMGGTIDIEYESDSYATVQDNRAMKHIDVWKMTNILDFLKIQNAGSFDGSGSYVTNSFSSNYGSETNLKNSLSGWTTTEFNDFKDLFLAKGKKTGMYKREYGEIDYSMVPNNVIIFRLDSPIPGTTSKTNADAEVVSKYLTNTSANGSKLMTELYLKIVVDVKAGIKENVPVFAKIMNHQIFRFEGTLPIPEDFKAYGAMPKAIGGDYAYGYVIIEPAQANEKKEANKDGKDTENGLDKSSATQINSLQKAALEYIRRNLADKLYGTCATCDANTDLDFAVLIGKDVNLAMHRRGWAQTFATNTSLRLYVPNNVKYGGNGRVKTITYSDGWDAISGEYVSTYQWGYMYTDRFGNSYGNAASEPRQGIDESPYYRWDSYSNFVRKYPDESKFTPTPIAADLLPPPIVGYERVEVNFLSAAIKGKSVSEFYTSKQYPFKEIIGVLDNGVHVDRPSSKITGRTTDIYGYSQGFVIKTNNFHGQPKQMLLYGIDANDNEIVQSRTTYNYNDLGDKVKMIDRSGVSTLESVAQEIDIHADSRKVENSFEHTEVGISVGIKYFTGNPVPLIIPMPIIAHTKRTQIFNSHALIKHVNQTAIVRSIETEYLGSINTAENLLYDKFSGNVILSALKDEYEDKLYSLSYPSHWFYKELREISNSQNAVVTTTVSTTGALTATGIDEELSPGDQVQLLNVAGQPIAWVAKMNPWPTNGNLYLMKADGTAHTGVTGSQQLKIVKSNRDNRLGETMQSVVTKKDPLSFLTMTFPTTEIIEAGAITYADKNNYKCVATLPTRPFNQVLLNGTINPYLYGTRGDLVLDGQFSWMDERNNALNPHKTRFDGTYLTTLDPIYKLVSGKWTRLNPTGHTNWRKMGEVTTYNQFGKPVESRDAIKVYSSVVYGYNNNFELVPIAQAVNARQQEIAFDGFEDYGYYANEEAIVEQTHFDYKAVLSGDFLLDNTIRHSGLQSLKVMSGKTATVSKKVSTACIADDYTTDISSTSVSVNTCNCIKPFEPTPGEYLVGAWVKNDNPLGIASGQIVITLKNGSTTLSTNTYSATGPVIEGWQRIEATFTIPSNATDILVGLKSSTITTYFDDVRLHPTLAGMTTVVYDPKTLLPMATHDGYNFTTFYNYDENLNQVRVKVETIEGIKTVSETETGGNKNPKN